MDHLRTALTRYNTTTLPLLPFTPAYSAITPILTAWGGEHLLNVGISGSNAKGTAIAGDSDLDLFVSLHPTILDLSNVTLSSIYNSLAQRMTQAGYIIRRQNVSVRITHSGVEVDIVPGVKFAGNTNDHWLHVTKSGRDRIKTNINTHIQRVSTSGRIDEIRLTKIWRKQRGLDFPSIYLEEVVMDCLSGQRYGDLANNFWRVLGFLANGFTRATYIDPANGTNIISNDLTLTEKNAIRAAAAVTRTQTRWEDVIWLF